MTQSSKNISSIVNEQPVYVLDRMIMKTELKDIFLDLMMLMMIMMIIMMMMIMMMMMMMMRLMMIMMMVIMKW